jgi:hypothetical protein
MAQFVSFDPNVKVRGESILAYMAALGKAAILLLEKHGFVNVRPEAWYPLQSLLDVFKEIYEEDLTAMLDLVHIGMEIPKHVLWPPEIQTVEEALLSINTAYHMNHKDGKIGVYRPRQVKWREFQIFCQNPYPCDFDYGLLYGIARLYLPPDGHLIVEHDADTPCRKHGAESCTYSVRW